MTGAMAGKRVTISQSTRALLETWWDYFMLFVDLAPTDVSNFVCIQVLWVTIVLAVYYSIHMILYNTQSADMSVTTPGATIKTMNDLLHEEEFKSVKPMIANFNSMVTVLSKSEEGTDSRRMYDKIVSEGGVLDVEPWKKDYEHIKQAQKIWYQMLDGLVAVIEDSSVLVSYVKHTAYHNNAKLTRRLKISQQVISPGLKGRIVSHDTNYEVYKLYEFRSRALYDLGLAEGEVQYFKTTMFPGYWNVELRGSGFECEESFLGTLIKEFHEELPLPFPITFYFKLMHVNFILILIAMISLFIEIVYSKGKRIIESLKKMEHLIGKSFKTLIFSCLEFLTEKLISLKKNIKIATKKYFPPKKIVPVAHHSFEGGIVGSFKRNSRNQTSCH